ncbi:MAG: hypothetical protein KKE94_15300 [Gammaproteobacteria bacterium]|nr:hypothetical protein [Gammaproteobacteria bacterium]
MLAFYQRWAYRFKSLHLLFLLGASAALGLFAWLVFAADAELSARWQLTAVVLAISCAVLWLWGSLFARNFTASATPTSVWQRVKHRLMLASYYVLALLFSVILLTTLYLGLRALKGIIAAAFF